MAFFEDKHEEIETILHEEVEDEKLRTMALCLNDLARNIATIGMMNPEEAGPASMSVDLISAIMSLIMAVDSGHTLEDIRAKTPELFPYTGLSEN